MKVVPVKTTVVNMETGAVKEEKTTDFKLLPPAPTACQTCAKDPAHDPDYPHDNQSMYYQYAFYGEHGRFPTWEDAMAHCSDQVKIATRQALRDLGVLKKST